MNRLKAKVEHAAAEFVAKRSPVSLPVIRRVGAAVARSQISRMAAALSYRTVFGLIPVLAIGVAFLGGFASDAEVEARVKDVLVFTGLDEIVVAPGDTGSAAARQRLDDWLQGLVMKVRDVSFVAIGLTGLLFLVYAALSFMVEIERSANTIYRAPAGRSWVRRIMQYWTTLTLGSLFLIGSFYIGRQLTDSIDSFADTLSRKERAAQTDGGGAGSAGDGTEVAAGASAADREAAASTETSATPPDVLRQIAAEAGGEPAPGDADDAGAAGKAGADRVQAADGGSAASEDGGTGEAPEQNLIAAGAGLAVSLAISFLLLLFLYMTIPNARVALHSAAIGAAFSAVLWEAGKWAFTIFVVQSAAQKLYGAIALVPLFLLWVYITWVILLFGLQISYVLQHFRAFSLPDAEPVGPVLVDPLALVRVAVVVAGRFVAGKTTSVSEVASAVGTDDRTTLAMLEKLQEAGVLHCVPVGDDREEFALARPAHRVQARDLLEIAARMSGSSKTDAESERLSRLREAQIEAASDQTLEDFVRREPPAETAEHDALSGSEPAPAA